MRRPNSGRTNFQSSALSWSLLVKSRTSQIYSCIKLQIFITTSLFTLPHADFCLTYCSSFSSLFSSFERRVSREIIATPGTSEVHGSWVLMNCCLFLPKWVQLMWHIFLQLIKISLHHLLAWRTAWGKMRQTWQIMPHYFIFICYYRFPFFSNKQYEFVVTPCVIFLSLRWLG